MKRISQAADSTVSSSEPPTHLPSAPRGADISDSSADDDLRKCSLKLSAAVPACGPCTRFPDAPESYRHAQLCGRDGVPLLSNILCQAFQAAYAVAASGASLPPFVCQVCLWSRALLLCRPSTLEPEGLQAARRPRRDGAACILSLIHI